jgi:CheY-like chemotaxis protein
VESTEANVSPDAGSAVRILVADDNEVSASSLAALLELRGHAVRVAGDGASAIELAESFRPHIALLDISMPRMDGYATAEAIRQRPWGNELLLVALTGWANSTDRARALKSGFDIHVAKPVDFDALDRIIGRFERDR